MTETIGQLEFPASGFMETRRGPIVEVALSGAPTRPERTYIRVPKGAGEIPAGVYSTTAKAVVDDDPEAGWFVTVMLEPEPVGSAVRADDTLDDDWGDERDLQIAERRDTFEPEEWTPQTEGDQPVNPFGFWALDEAGHAFLIDFDAGDDDDAPTIEALSRYGKSLHPWQYAVEPSGPEPDDASLEAVAAGDATLEWQLHRYDGSDLVAYQRWRVGRRRAIEAEAPHPLPEFDPGQWMRWLTPLEGGAAVAFGGFYFPEKRSIELQPVMPAEPEWARGRVLTIPRERPGQEYEGRREVTVYGKPHAELRSSVAKIRKRPPVPLGRFALQPEGFMPSGWSALG